MCFHIVGQSHRFCGTCRELSRFLSLVISTITKNVIMQLLMIIIWVTQLKAI